MAGPQDIQRFPRGLLGLLGIQATGDTPHQISGLVSGLIDMLPYYINDRQQFTAFPLSGPINATGVLQFPLSIVPSGTLRLVYNAGVLVPATAAATALKTRLCIFRSPNLGGETYIGETLTLGALDSGTIAATFDSVPAVLLPGQSFGLRTTTVTGVPAASPVLGVYFADIQI